MKKFKALLLGALSVLTLGLFVVTGARVNAESVALYNANNDNNSSYAKNTEITAISDDTLGILTRKLDNEVSTAVALGNTFTKGLSCTSNTSSTKNFEITNKLEEASIDVTLLVGACDSSTPRNFYATEATFGSNTTTTSTTAPVSITTRISPKSMVTFYTNGRRAVIYSISYEVVSSNNFTATFALNGGTGTAPNDISVSKTAESKTITLPSIGSVTKTGYSFGGWYDGDSTNENNPYSAGDSYTLSKDTTFSAIWNVSVEAISSDFDYTFTSKTGNGEEIVIENGNLYSDNYIKLESSTIINFETTKEMMIVLTFNNNALSNGFKLDDTQTSIDTTTCKYIGKLSAGAHTIKRGAGNDVRLGKIELISESVTPLVQKATVDEYTYVRFVTIIKGVEEISAADVTFSVTMDYADTSKDDKTNVYTPYVVKKITQNNATYTATVGSASHTFDNSVNPTEYYVVYVLRLTTSKFSGNSIKATTTFGGTSYESNSIEI